MIIKKKHIVVVFFSSLVIVTVLASTLIGYTLYMQWKKDSIAIKYRSSIYKLTAELFKKDILFSNVDVELGKEEPFFEMPLIRGNLKNESNKTITSVLIEVALLRSDDTVYYKGWFNPLEQDQLEAFRILSDIKEAQKVLFPKESISFKYLLKNCPREVIAQLSAKTKSSKSSSESKMRLVYTIIGLGVL